MDTDLLLKFAKFFAATKHQGQMYAGGLPYTHHLAAVEAVMRRFPAWKIEDSKNDPRCQVCGGSGTYENGHNGDEEDCGCTRPDDRYDVPSLLVATWLHDVVEDTETKVKEIEEMFGESVATLVAAVTNEDGPSRKVRTALTYPKIRNAGKNAVRLKLADRIANVETGGKLVEMYRKEHEDFRRALYTPGENEDMWTHLNGLLKR